MEHLFTNEIIGILEKRFEEFANDIFERSELLQYLNHKTKSANRGSKSRGSFANLYAIYVLTEDYLAKNYDITGDYAKYDGAEYSKLLARQRELPFGTKLQNHALNNRMKEEFKKFFPNSKFEPILRNFSTNRYWINENLLKVKVNQENHNIAKLVIEIIDAYIATKQDAFQQFIKACEMLQNIDNEDSNKIELFICNYLGICPIVSFAI